MGASLIVTICKGPAVLDVDKRQQAIEQVKKVQDALRHLQEVQDGDEDIDPVVQRDEDLTRLSDYGFEFYPEELSALVEADAENVVQDLYDTWHGRFRDSASRSDPDDANLKIVVAGDSTWGDSPDGAAYASLIAAEKFGLFPIYNIR